MNVTAYLEHFYGNYNQKFDKQFYQDKSLSGGYGSSGSNVSGRRNEIISTGRSNRYVNYTEPKYYLGECRLKYVIRFVIRFRSHFTISSIESIETYFDSLEGISIH